MRGILTITLILGLLITTSATATGGLTQPGPAAARAITHPLPVGIELNDDELDQITGEFLPVWAAIAVSLIGRAAVAAAINAVRGAIIGAPAGVLPEIGRQIDQGDFNAKAIGCAALGGSIAGAIGGPLSPGAATVPGGLGLLAGGFAGSRCQR